MTKDPMPFKIWGDYGYQNETMIISFDSEWQARDFFANFVQTGEYDGEYEIIELAVFQGDEYVPLLRRDVEVEEEGVLVDEW